MGWGSNWDNSDTLCRSVAFQTLHVSTEFRCALIAYFSVFLEGLHDQIGQFRRKPRIQLQGRWRRAVQNGIVHNRGCSPRKDLAAGCHFIEDRTEGKEITSRVETLAARLFGGHVSDRAHRYARMRESISEFILRRIGR